MAAVSLVTQLVWLVILAAAVACVSWTVTHEQLFEEWRTWCTRKSERARQWYVKKWFYLFTCEYCFSHYVSAVVVGVTGFRLLLPGWRGFAIAWLTCVWVANIYMSLFGRLRLDIKREKVEIEEVQDTPQSTGRKSMNTTSHPSVDVRDQDGDEVPGDTHAADIVGPTGEEMPEQTHAEVHRPAARAIGAIRPDVSRLSEF